MGRVYCAYDNEARRDVAIKFLLGKLTKRERSCKRFKREAIIATKLKHPGIVKVFDYGTEPRPYIVMEKLEGLPLRKYIRSKQLSYMQVMHLSLQICDILQYAHSKGIVHRDLKPDNIFVEPPNKQIPYDHVKLLDFGLARMTKDNATSKLTKVGTALGTCTYMAPEQAAGKEADERSDLYSLGIILYEFIVGMTPFSADEHEAVLYMQVHSKPEDPCQVNPDLPKPVGELLLWILNKRPEDRPQSALQLKKKIEEILAYLEKNALVSRPSILLPELSNQDKGVKIIHRSPNTDLDSDTAPMPGIAAPAPQTPTYIPAPGERKITNDNTTVDRSPLVNRDTRPPVQIQQAPPPVLPKAQQPEAKFYAPVKEVPQKPLQSEKNGRLTPENIIRSSIDNELHNFDFPEVEFKFPETAAKPAPTLLPPLPPKPAANVQNGRFPVLPYRLKKGKNPPGKRCLVAMLYMAVDKYAHLCPNKQAQFELSEAIAFSMREAVDIYKGQTRKYNGEIMCALFTGGQDGLRAAQAAQKMRRELEAIKFSFGFINDLSLKVGIYSTELTLTADDRLRPNDENNLRFYAERLASISRSEAQGATVVNSESLDQRMQYEFLRTIFIGGGRSDAVYLHKITVLP